MPEKMKSKRQSGYILTWVLILTALGALVTAALLDYASAALRKQGNFYDSILEREAAEAGLNRVVADLIRGVDGIDTTYIAEQPHRGGGSYSTFTFYTTYTQPTININYLTPTFTISQPPSAVMPTGQQQYIDPGVTNPDFATLPPRYGYILRMFQVQAGTIVVNWAYSPAGGSRIGIWAGVPVDDQTGQPHPPGRISSWPHEAPVLDTGNTSASAVYNRSAAVQVSAGIYTIVFYNSSGNDTKTTAAFVPSGGIGDTWVYITAYRDYLVSVTANDSTVDAYVRQIPGYTQPPNTSWGTSNISWITNSVYIRSFNRP